MGADLAAYERSFRRAGMPLLIEDYDAYEDVFTRASPLLALVFGAQLLGAVTLHWPWWANGLALAGGLVLLLGPVAVLNRRRGRRALTVPERVGKAELTAFVFVPALLPLVFGGQVLSAAVTATANTLLLLAVYLIVGFGVLSIVRWTAGRLVGQLASSLQLLTRAVPVLLVFMIVMFVNSEMWQVFSDISDVALLGIVGLFVVLGSSFLTVRLPRQVRELEREVGAEPPLRRVQLLNVGLVMFVSQGLQVLFVSVLVGAFFVAFGALAITPEVVQSWIGERPNDLGQGVVTEELLKVSVGLAAFSGLYYAIVMLSDSAYREEFLEELTSPMRATFRERAEYLAARPKPRT